ncbi:MAG: selenocysteine-specific translation elongation factor [Sulfuricella sp.]|nr:selenocysteine-specific translation elongation factor [Sulfuricella sp.]
MIIGTAGHIDHGKTSLVQRLTGIDTDRLPEEKRRGLTIDLGFAHLELPEAGAVGVVDVPGHERFIHNMVAGATGIDVVLLTVAADDGIMPQTLEHLDIISLLGITRGVVALNKIDLASPERVQAVAEEIRTLLAGTPLAGAALVPVSARSGEGIDALRQALAEALCGIQARKVSGWFRLPLDRAFVMPGFGTVVTGTIAAGEVRKNDRLRLLPGGETVRVRGIQVHGRAAESAPAGSRCALNIAGSGKETLRRGMMLADPRLERTARVVDVSLRLAPHAGRIPKNHSRVRLHTGTAEVFAWLSWLEEAALPDKSILAQLRLEEGVPLLYGDRFIVRSEEAMQTLGGGVVLDAQAMRRGARRPERLARLKRLQSLDPEQALTAWLEAHAATGWFLLELAEQLGEPPERLSERLALRRDVVREEAGGTLWVALAKDVAALETSLFAALSHYLAANPRMTAMPSATLHSSACPRLDDRVFRFLVARLASGGRIAQGADGLRPAGHRQQFSAEDLRLAERLEGLLACHGTPPPKPEALALALGLPAQRLTRFLGDLLRSGQVVKVAADVYLSRRDVDAWRDSARRLLEERGAITLAEFRDAIGVGRGLALQVLEHFDRTGLTRRQGEGRVATSATRMAKS